MAKFRYFVALDDGCLLWWVDKMSRLTILYDYASCEDVVLTNVAHQ